MKKTRESSNAQITIEEKQNLVACLASAGATVIDIDMFTPDNADLIAHGFTPSPRSIEDETKQWYDVIHAQPNVYGTAVNSGYMRVLDRCVVPQTGDDQGKIAGYNIETSTPNGTAITAPSDGSTTWVGRYCNYLYNHVGLDRLRTGDIQMPFAEMGSLNSTHWTTWPNAAVILSECHKVCNTAATAAGVSVVFTGNVNWDDVNSGAWSGMLDSGISCFDCYGVHLKPGGKPSNYVTQFLQNYAGQSDAGYGIPAGGKPMFWGEFADLAHAMYLSPTNVTGSDNFAVGTTTVEQWEYALVDFFKTIRDGLINVSPRKLIGFNWWGGWEGQNTSILIKTGSGVNSKYTLNWRGQILRNFYINDGMGRTPVVTGTYTEAGPSFGGRQQYF